MQLVKGAKGQKRPKPSRRMAPRKRMCGGTGRALPVYFHSRNYLPCLPNEVDEDSDLERDDAEWEVRSWPCVRVLCGVVGVLYLWGLRCWC